MTSRPILSALDHSSGGGGRARVSRTVLVVEREEPLRALIRRTLESDGHEVLEAGDAVEALAAVSSRVEPVDLVLADLIEPGITGPTGLLTRLAPGTRVLLLSLFAGELNLPAQFAITVLKSPFRADVLREKVREIFGHS